MAASAKRLSGLVSPLLRQAGIYTASHLASRVIPFLLLPVLTRYLSPADYGIVAMFLITAVIVEPFITLGLAGVLTVKYYDRSTDLPAYVSTGIAVAVGIAAIVAVLLLILQEPLSDLTEVPRPWLLLVVPLVLSRALGAILLNLLRVRERAIAYGVLQNLQSVALLSLSLLLVVALGRTWRGRLEAELIAYSAFAAFSILFLWRSGWVRLGFVKSYARDLAAYGVPLIPHTVGAIMMTQTDRLLVTNLLGVGETGLYTVGYQLAVVIEVVAVSFNYAYVPWLFRHLTDADDEIKRSLVKKTYVHFAAMAILAMVVAIVIPRLADLALDPRFSGAGQYVGWFAVGFLFSGMYYMVTNYIFFAQRTKWLAAVTITVALINIPLTYLLIKANGGIGAAQATAISLGLSFVCTWIASQRVYPMPWSLRRPITVTPDPPADG